MIGQIISHYKILEKLGAGGMGVVYKAQDAKLDRFVALKFLPQYLNQAEEEKQRFIHEAKTASALNHPNIATIYEIDEADGQMFIAMEYIEGQSLQEMINTSLNALSKGDLKESPLEEGAASTAGGVIRPLPLDKAIDYATQIAAGLQAAHAKGIIHRDIKPANILVTEDDVVKIVDFGLSKLAGRTMLTKEGTTLGTVAYMSPEQTQSAKVDHRTDIWALGAVLYELVSGRPPFRGDYEQAVIYSITNEEPEPITAIRSGVPMELERIINKCLDKEPRKRYQHADELIVDLQRVQEYSKTAGVAPKPSLPTKRKQLTAALAVVAVLVVIIVSYFFVTRDEQNPERLPIAVVDFINETNEPELDGLSGMLITALEQSRRLAVFTRGRMFDVLKQLDKGEVQRLDENLGREICRKAGINLMAIASIRKFGQTYAADLKLLDHRKTEYLTTARAEVRGQENIPDLIDELAKKTRKALREREPEIRATSRRTASVTTVNLEAYQHFFKGEELLNIARTEELEEAISEFIKAIAIDSTFALAYYRLGYSHHLNGHTDEAREALQQALTMIDRMPEKEQYMARAYAAHLGHTPEELSKGLGILREMEKIYPDDKEMIFFIGDWSYHNVQFETAVEYLKWVLQIDPDFRRGLYHLFLTYRDMGDYDNALAIGKHMHELERDIVAYWMLGTAYGRMAQFEPATSNLKKGLAIAKDIDLYHELAYVYYLQDSLIQAERVLTEAFNENLSNIWSNYLLTNILMKKEEASEVETFARRVASENPGFHGDNILAHVLAVKKIDIDQALVLAEKAMQTKPLRHSERARAIPFYILPEYTLGLAYIQRGDNQKAAQFLRKAAEQAPLRRDIKETRRGR